MLNVPTNGALLSKMLSSWKSPLCVHRVPKGIVQLRPPKPWLPQQEKLHTLFALSDAFASSLRVVLSTQDEYTKEPTGLKNPSKFSGETSTSQILPPRPLFTSSALASFQHLPGQLEHIGA